jgi:hypothetical protein
MAERRDATLFAAARRPPLATKVDAGISSRSQASSVNAGSPIGDVGGHPGNRRPASPTPEAVKAT